MRVADDSVFTPPAVLSQERCGSRYFFAEGADLKISIVRLNWLQRILRAIGFNIKNTRIHAARFKEITTTVIAAADTTWGRGIRHDCLVRKLCRIAKRQFNPSPQEYREFKQAIYPIALLKSTGVSADKLEEPLLTEPAWTIDCHPIGGAVLRYNMPNGMKVTLVMDVGYAPANVTADVRDGDLAELLQRWIEVVKSDGIDSESDFDKVITPALRRMCDHTQWPESQCFRGYTPRGLVFMVEMLNKDNPQERRAVGVMCDKGMLLQWNHQEGIFSAVNDPRGLSASLQAGAEDYGLAGAIPFEMTLQPEDYMCFLSHNAWNAIMAQDKDEPRKQGLHRLSLTLLDAISALRRSGSASLQELDMGNSRVVDALEELEREIARGTQALDEAIDRAVCQAMLAVKDKERIITAEQIVTSCQQARVHPILSGNSEYFKWNNKWTVVVSQPPMQHPAHGM